MTTNKQTYRIDGLIAATFCPFKTDGSVNYDVIPQYVDLLHRNGVIGVFVNGSCGEGPSLSTDERRHLAEEWVKHGKDKFQEIIIHCGSSNLPEAKTLAAHAQQIGATGVACVPPYYYKITTVEGIANFLQEVANSCKKLPFYYYHFPGITAVNHSAKSIFEALSSRVENLAGMKFTSADIKDACAVANMAGNYQCMGGFDDLYLSYMTNGLGSGTVGAFHNFMPRVSLRIRDAYNRGDMDTARLEQSRIHKICDINAKYTTGLVCREFMDMLGLDIGPPRAPQIPMTQTRKDQMKQELKQIGFFDWII